MGLLASVRYILMSLMELPTGVFADLWGRRISCTIGAFLDAFGLILIVLMPSSLWIIIGTLIRAVGESAMSGANTALIYDTLKENNREAEYVKVASKEGIIVQISLVISTLTGGFLYSINPTIPFLFTGISIFVSAFFYLNMKEPKIDTTKYSWTIYIQNTKSGVKELFKNTYTKYLSMYFLLVGGITWAWMTYSNLVFIDSMGFSESSQGVILSMFRIINAVIIGIFAVKFINFTKSHGAWVHPIIMGLGSLLALIPINVVGSLAILLLMSASSLRFNLLNKLTNEVFNSRHRATALSTLNLLSGIIYAIIVAASGPIMELTSPRWIYFFTGILPLPLIIFLVIKMKQNYNLNKSV